MKNIKLKRLSELHGDKSCPRNEQSADPFSSKREKKRLESIKKGLSIVNVSTAYCRSVDIYVLGKFVATLSYHRYIGLINYLNNDNIPVIDNEILSNYITHGYNTRVGLVRAQKKIDRIKQIAKSHTYCTMHGREGHDYRVIFRN